MWTVVEGIAVQGLSLAVFLVLARMLEPSFFGTIAMGLIVIEFLVLAFIGPIGVAIMIARDPGDEDFSAAFWLTIAISLVLTAVIIGIAPFVARIAGLPDLTMVIVALSPTILFYGLSVVPEVRLSRGMMFRKLAIRRILAALFGGVAGVAAALGDYGITALILQQVITSLAGTVIIWLTLGWRPKLIWPGQRALAIGRSAASAAPNGLAYFVTHSFDVSAVIFFAGPTAGGIYNAARRIRLAAQIGFVHSLARVGLSLFSGAQGDSRQLADTFEKTTAMFLFATVPLFAGLAAVAPEFCDVLFGARWIGVAPVLAVLMLACPMALIANNLESLLLIKRRAHWLSMLKIAHVVLFVGAVALSGGESAIRTAVATLLPYLVVLPIMAILAARWTPFRLRHFLWLLCGPIVSSGLMVAGIVLTRGYIAHMPTTWRLVLLIVVGAAIYGLSSLVVSRSLALAVWRWIPIMIRRQFPASHG